MKTSGAELDHKEIYKSDVHKPGGNQTYLSNPLKPGRCNQSQSKEFADGTSGGVCLACGDIH